MRLINSRTYVEQGRLELEELTGDQIPRFRYAILSHTWGENEVTFQDIQHHGSKIFSSTHDSVTWTTGVKKIDYLCKQAFNDKFDYAWIDTLCIDKQSSAELSEAINSMFNWYARAGACYVYLSDVTIPKKEIPKSPAVNSTNMASIFPRTRSLKQNKKVVWVPPDLHKSRWFTRGWTLQELLAPSTVTFFSSDWSFLGDLKHLMGHVSAITRIPVRILSKEQDIQRASVAQRMSWASQRQTTRIEDRAYSLLGIFDVNMPLIYGEEDRAFTRLQQEIIRVSNDWTLFAWGLPEDQMLKTPFETSEPSDSKQAVLAISPSDFAHTGSVVKDELQDHPAFEITNAGMRTEIHLVQWTAIRLAVLPCRRQNDLTGLFAISLSDDNHRLDSTLYLVARAETVTLETRLVHLQWQRNLITPRRMPPRLDRTPKSILCHVRRLPGSFSIECVEGLHAVWQPEAMAIRFDIPRETSKWQGLSALIVLNDMSTGEQWDLSIQCGVNAYRTPTVRFNRFASRFQELKDLSGPDSQAPEAWCYGLEAHIFYKNNARIGGTDSMDRNVWLYCLELRRNPRNVPNYSI